MLRHDDVSSDTKPLLSPDLFENSFDSIFGSNRFEKRLMPVATEVMK